MNFMQLSRWRWWAKKKSQPVDWDGRLTECFGVDVVGGLAVEVDFAFV